MNWLLISIPTATVAALAGTWSPCGLSMLSTFTPIREAAHGRRFAVTAAWFILGAVLGNALLVTLFAWLARPWDLGWEGAVVLGSPDNNDGSGELKRMFVLPAHRGGGRARQLLAHLEALGRERGCRVLRLETGIHQHEALAFYAAAGYQRRGPFADYPNDPLSVFMEKVLST